MPTFPTFTRPYTLEGYSYSVGPDIDRTVFYTGNSRQRKRWTKRDDLFNARLVLSDSEFETFESFITTDLTNGSATYSGPYYTSDIEQTGTLEIIEGTYTADYLPPSSWAVSFQFEVKDRSLTDEDGIYDLIIGIGTFTEAYNIFDALEDMVNYNNL